MNLKILHTNDFHGTLRGGKLASLEILRHEANLYFDGGDAIRAGNLGIPMHTEEVWSFLADLQCSASVMGNRESHIIESGWRAKLAGATHPVLCGNLRRKNGERPLPGTVTFNVNGLRVGVIGVMVAMVTDRMATRAASAFLWDPPIETAVSLGNQLRGSVDCLIGLTHIGFNQDQILAQQSTVFDVILGGHSHTVLEQPVLVNQTWIAQGGSHGRFAGVYEWSPTTGLTGYLKPL